MNSVKTDKTTRAGPSHAGESRGRSQGGRPCVYGGANTIPRSRPRHDDKCKPTTDSNSLYDTEHDEQEVEACAPKVHAETSDHSKKMTDSELGSEASATSALPDKKVRPKPTRKRRKEIASLHENSSLSEEEVAPAPKFSTARRGKKVGSGQRADYYRRVEELEELDFNADLDRRAKASLVRRERSQAGSISPNLEDPKSKVDYERLDLEQLRARGGLFVSEIARVSQASGRLQGPLKGALNRSADNLAGILDQLAARSETEENRRLRIDNANLRREMESLHVEIRALKREMAELTANVGKRNVMPPPAVPSTHEDDMEAQTHEDEMEALAPARDPLPQGALCAQSIEELLQMACQRAIDSAAKLIDARLGDLESRLPPQRTLRPPLASDSRTASAPTASSAPAAGPTPGPKRKRTAARPPPPSQPEPVASSQEVRATTSTAPPAETWATVTRRGKKGKPRSAAASQPAPAPKTAPTAPKPKPKVKLTPPRSAAIVVTLQPEAEKRGATYKKVLTKAKAAVDLAELGIPNIKVTDSATGARLIEVPGAESKDKADKLAIQLRAALGGDVIVTRPEKRADMRIIGLDESVTREEVAEAVASRTGCSQEAVRVGEIRRSTRGEGTTTISCPVVAAKALSEAGRLLVGWSSARVQVLDPRPMRCFKCMGLGHTRQLCPSTVDRSGLCFRCGNPGHKAADCDGQAHCAVCAEASCDISHHMGGRNCKPPQKRGKAVPRVSTPLIEEHHERCEEANLNHAAGAQDLFLQSLAAWNIDVAVASEPYWVPPQPHWVGDAAGDVAIICRNGPATTPLNLRDRGPGFVTAQWGRYAIVGVYFSPNKPLSAFETFLGVLGPAIRRLAPLQVILMGDLNAKSRMWGGNFTDVRGRALEDWVAELGLSVLNTGTAHTCVRAQGGSRVDVSFATPAVAQRVVNWRVMEEETLSDHLYIRFEVSPSTTPRAPRRTGHSAFPRWATTKLDKEKAEEAAIVQAWCSKGSPHPSDADAGAACLRAALTQTCDAAMPRAQRTGNRRQVYWWSQEIADLRATSNAARRAYLRHRRRATRDPVEEERLRVAYKEAKRTLQVAIMEAKAAAHNEMLEELDGDPWGRPYRAARNKLRGQSAPVAETIEPDLLRRVLGSLFPQQGDFRAPAPVRSRRAQSPEPPTPPVSMVEVGVALDRLHGSRKAPGPDGVPGKILRLFMQVEENEDRLRELFDLVFRTSQFPKIWKDGRLCLLRKEGRPPDSPSAYRPIVLLDEAGKVLERIIVSRLTKHLNDVGPNLSERQFGFRAGRSTLDALSALKSKTEEAVSRGERALAVSLDIANAFNSLPFDTIVSALHYHGVPAYLIRIVADYLRDRQVSLVGADGELVQQRIFRGVPQGSALGPTLWNIAYDSVLRCRLLRGTSLLCYADDTLVVATGRALPELCLRIEAATEMVVARIRAAGLEVAPHKTEALMFHGPRKGPPPGAHLNIEGVRVRIGGQMKYLGLVLDGRWNFHAHFEGLAPKLTGAAAALGRLLPNTRGPSMSCRKLYAGVIKSMALYGAPIWVGSLDRENRAALRRPQRTIALRAIRGYRTVSHGAACVLAGLPPWELEAEVLDVVYQFRTSRREAGERPAYEEVERVRELAREELLRRWERELVDCRYGVRTIEAIRPVLDQWVHRRHGFLTYRLVQVLTGHGCFGWYLHLIGREPSPECHECGAAEDTAQHTLEVCPAWVQQRRALTAVTGPDLALPSVVVAMLLGESAWDAMVSFCEEVMLQKETAERAREVDPEAHALRRRRPGGRRRRFARLLPPP
ncbi:uncharacterized protein LOC135079532 [Ostrinia nubilalis]|uniref:uncharacterized protein LOC135079532 n=1 Tax=Ostrinia nubilalis TaxID=29057 RepID=UPI0030822458